MKSFSTVRRHRLHHHFPCKSLLHKSVLWHPRNRASTHNASTTSHPVPPNRAYIALGSNISPRVSHISRACSALDDAGLRVLRTSFLYETSPMYVTDQAPFLNGVCETYLPESCTTPDLLHIVKRIESELGRVKSIDKGPRNIDLDILLAGPREYANTNPHSELDLTVPHESMLEREFVLRPLTDLIPDCSHPAFPGMGYARRLERLVTRTGSSREDMPIVSEMSPRGLRFSPSCGSRKTQLMAILNVTPDSFSDGDVHSPSDLSDSAAYLTRVMATVREMYDSGATILDIGGQSSRPHAASISAEEEISRVLPVIQAIRSDSSLDGLAISIDTYRSSVARAAVKAGADIVNDISAGLLDSDMLSTVAELGCGVVLSHTRGTPDTMNKLTDYKSYAGGSKAVASGSGGEGAAGGAAGGSDSGVISGIEAELSARVDEAMAAGIRRWKIMLDPGIGFAKTASQNAEILRHLQKLREGPLKGFPWLVGSSRKGFVGKATGVQEPERRQFGTAATVAASVAGGADCVRVHDVPEMRQVGAMADAIWRI